MNKAAYISFIGAIDGVNVREICRTINGLILDGTPDITLIIQSTGGSIAHGIFLHNYLRSLKPAGANAPVLGRGLDVGISTHCMGEAASIAVPVFLAGTARTCSANARFMLHPSTFGPVTEPLPASALNDNLQAILQDEDRIDSIISERTNLSREDLMPRRYSDVYYDAHGALAAGIVDRIEELSIPPDATIYTI